MRTIEAFYWISLYTYFFRLQNNLKKAFDRCRKSHRHWTLLWPYLPGRCIRGGEVYQHKHILFLRKCLYQPFQIQKIIIWDSKTLKTCHFDETLKFLLKSRKIKQNVILAAKNVKNMSIWWNLKNPFSYSEKLKKSSF